MTELQELLRQRNEIESKIRALEKNETTFGRVMYGKQQQPSYSNRGATYYVALEVPYTYVGKKKTHWMKIIDSEDPKDAIEQIKPLITDLQALYDNLKGNITNGETD